MSFATFHLLTIVVALAVVGNGLTIDPFEIVEAEDYDEIHGAGVYTCSSPSLIYVGSINAGDYFGFYGVNFASGAQKVRLQIASWSSGTVELRLDSHTTAPFATIPVQKVGDEADACNNFVTIEQFVTTVPTGVHNLYFTFVFPAGVTDFVYIDWFSFRATA